MQHIIHLSKDKKLKKVIGAQEPFLLDKRKKVYLHLCKSIMSQQLSTKVATVIFNRFIDLFDTKTPTAQQIVEMPFEKLRAIGLSNAKVNYVHNVCKFFIAEKLEDKKLHKLTDEEVVAYLTQIKGVGRWTAEMILMFTLGREDVFAVDDLGIQQGMVKLYDLDMSDKKALKEKMIQLSDKWKPYRTYACRYIWNWKDKNK
jgi:DNA-3-methyladenine glycosylase II